jgi:molybdenum cofactor cytidylyltransferase
VAESFALAAIILAAGRSTRMQDRNKLLLPWGEKRVLQVVVETLLSVPFAQVLVVTGHQREEVQGLLAGYPVRMVDNPRYAEGLSTSLRRGVEEAGAQAEGYLFALGDMPRVALETVLRLCQSFALRGPGAIAVPTFEGRRGNPVVIGREYREELLQLEGDQGARPLVQKHAQRVVEVPVDDPGIHVDVDTPQAYSAALP